MLCFMAASRVASYFTQCMLLVTRMLIVFDSKPLAVCMSNLTVKLIACKLFSFVVGLTLV